MKASYFLFFLVNTLCSLAYIILKPSLYYGILFFEQSSLIMICNFIYYLFMTYYSFTIQQNQASSNESHYFRDTVFQILYIINAGSFILMIFLILIDMINFNQTMDYLLQIYFLLQYIFFFIDSFIIHRTHGDYSIGRVMKKTMLLSILIFLLSLLIYIKYTITIKIFFFTLFKVIIVYFSGVGLFVFFQIFRPLRNFSDFGKDKSDKLTVSTAKV